MLNGKLNKSGGKEMVEEKSVWILSLIEQCYRFWGSGEDYLIILWWNQLVINCYSECRVSV